MSIKYLFLICVCEREKKKEKKREVFDMILIVKENHFCRNNAGIFSQNLEFSEDKIEMTYATNYLGNLLICPYIIDSVSL